MPFYPLMPIHVCVQTLYNNVQCHIDITKRVIQDQIMHSLSYLHQLTLSWQTLRHVKHVVMLLVCRSRWSDSHRKCTAICNSGMCGGSLAQDIQLLLGERWSQKGQTEQWSCHLTYLCKKTLYTMTQAAARKHFTEVYLPPTLNKLESAVALNNSSGGWIKGDKVGTSSNLFHY